MDAKKCDRCGKFYEKHKPTLVVNRLSYTAPECGNLIREREKMDLCLDCTDALARFLYNAEPPYDEPEVLKVYPMPSKGKKHDNS